MKIKLFLLIAIVLMPHKALSSEGLFKYGKTASTDGEKTLQSKIFGLGYQEIIDSGIMFKAEGDLINTPSEANTMSYIYSMGLGPKVDAGSVFATAVWGPSYLSKTDDELGGHFQFMQDLTFGLQDRHNTIGLGYKHISSAGFEKPNRGKDFLYIELGAKF